MSDVTALADAYVASWNETVPARRQAAIANVWADKSLYADPLMKSEGHAAIDEMIAGVQGRFSGFVLKRTSKVDSHNGNLRFTWSLGPAAGPAVVEGVDFCNLSSDGKLASVVGFIDKMPT